MTSACLSQTSKTHVHHSALEKSKAFPLLKMCRLSRVYILAKGDKDVPSAYCSKRRIRMRTCHAHVLNPHLLFFSLSPISLSLEGFLGTSATDDFDLLILRSVYILIMYGELLVPSPVTLVVDLREIEGRTPRVRFTSLP